MAKFTGTAGPDTFIGTSNVIDEFDFAVAALSGSDTVNGGTGPTIDFMKFTTAGTVAAAAFAKVTHIEELVLANGTNNFTLTDALVGSSDNRFILVYGSTGNDTVDASAVTTAANRLNFHGLSGNDTLKGGAGADLFYFTPADLTSGDTLIGGGGTDNLIFTAAGTLAAGALTNVSGIEQVYLASGTNSIAIANATVTSATSHVLTVWGGTGNDSINASAVTTATNRVVFRAGAGNDTLTGGSGNDIFYVTASDLTSGDIVAGGAGYDNLGFTGGGTISASAMSHVGQIEAIVIIGFGANLTLTNALVASALVHILTVTGSSNGDTINAADVTTPANRVVLNGGAGDDLFLFSQASLDSLDTVSGGDGLDTLRFTSAVTVAASAFAHVTGIETLTLIGGGPNNVALSNAMVTSTPTGVPLNIFATNGDDRIDASAVTDADAAVRILAGAGIDTFIGGAGNDTFTFTHGAFTSADHIDGGAGSDILVIETDGTNTIGAAQLGVLSGIETLDLNAAPGFLVNVTLTEAFVASAEGRSVTVDGFNMKAGTLDASALTAADSVSILFASAQTVIGGAGDDDFTLGHLESGGTLDGGAGIDTYHGIVAGAVADGMSGIEIIDLKRDGFADLTDSIVSSATDHLVTLLGGVNPNRIDASAVTSAGNRVVMTGGGGADDLTGGAGADVFVYGAASDSFGPLANSKFMVINWDEIHGLDTANDKIDLPDGALDHNLAIGQVTGQVNQFTNASDIDAALDPVLGAHQAVLFHTTGDYGGLDLLVINPTDTAGYTAGISYVIDITGYSGTITPELFI